MAGEQMARSPIAAGDLVLRPVSPALAAALMAGDLTAVQAGEGWPHEDTMDGLAMVAQDASLGWLVTANDVVVGDCGTHGRPGPDGVVEIGYGLAAPYRGRGYGRLLVRALAWWLLGQPGVTAVIAHTDPANVPSRRCLESAGFRLDGEDGVECRYFLGGAGQGIGPS